jgi:hypothetical protein
MHPRTSHLCLLLVLFAGLSTLSVADAEVRKLGGSVGGNGGAPFDDSASLPKNPVIREIVVRSGMMVDSVRLVWTHGLGYPHGGNGGTQSVIALAPGEYVTGLDVHSSSVINQITIITNIRRYGPFGTSNGQYENLFKATPGHAIVGFYGRCGMLIDQIGPIYERLPGERKRKNIGYN